MNMIAEIAIEYPCQYRKSLASEKCGEVVRRKSRFTVKDIPIIPCAPDDERLREAWLFSNALDALTAYALLRDRLASAGWPMDYDGPDNGVDVRFRTPDEERYKLTLKIKEYGSP